MALDPLRFAIEIADEASQKIKAIKDELNKLEPKIKVTFDESSINVAQLRTALENAIKSLGEIKVSGAGLNISGDALGGAADKITEAKEAIKGGRFGELAKRINEATTELERLTKAFETFQLTIGKDKGLKDFMTGLGEVISNVKTQLGALDKVSNSETSITKTTEKVETNRRKFNELIEAAGKLRTELVSVDSAALNLNMDNPSMRNSIKVINDFIAKLRELRENGGVDFKNNHAVNELIAQFTRLKSALTDVSSEQQRLNKSVSAEGARDDANAAKEARQNYEAWVESIRRATVEHTKLAITIAQLEDKERKASVTGVDTKDLKDQIAGLKQYKDTLKEIADGQKQHGLAKDFIRRADVESAILLAKREGEVVMQNAKAREQSDKQMLRDIKQADENQQRFNKVLAEAVAMQERLANAGNKGTHLALDTAKVDEASVKVQQYIDKLLVLDQTQFGSAAKAEWKTIEAGLKAAAVAQEKLNKATEQQQEKDRNRAIKQQAKDAADAAKETEKWANSQNQASIEANKLVQKMRELKAAKMTGKEMGVDTTELERNMAVMQRYLNKLFAIANGVQKFGHTGDFLGEAPFKIAAFNADKAATNINRLAGDAQKAASATSQLTAEEQRLAQALNQTTEHARGQSQVLSDLKSMAMQYLGVWGGQQFLHNIIEIGGQLEMQRLSIGAILQNQSQANDLFERIKGLAVQSPFGVVELDQMTKQLTAYGFKYNELFDMTKRLADISAATGTGVDRLALALGHVRSEAALSGYTLRQFSMANVPLLQKLSEKLGKTTQEIRKMVRAKEVSYEDVIGVLKDITNEGGMFYNMQEVISQSVKARFKNVKDAMDIMYGEMAESGIGDALKGVADVLMEVTRNWKDAATVLTTGAALWATQRVAIMAYTAAIGKETTATFASISANVKKQGTMLQLANRYRVLTTAERDMLNASRANSAMIKLRTLLHMNYTKKQGEYIAAQRLIITNSLTQQLSEGKLTVAELAHMVATRKLTHEEARLIITNSSLDASMKSTALSIIGSTRQLGRLELAFRRVGMAMKSLGAMAWSFLPMAAITAMVELWQRNSRELERTKEIADSIYERSQEALKNTRTMMQETDIKTYWRRDDKSDWEDVSGNFGGQVGGERKVVLPTIDMTNAQEAIEKWTQYIRDYAATPNVILNNALFDTKENVRSLEEQFDNLKHKVVEVADAQVLLQGLGSAFEEALNKTNGGWLDDDLVTNIEDYNKSIKQFGKNVSSVYKAYRKSVDTAIKIARQQDTQFDSAVQSMGSYSQQLEYLVKNQDEYTKAVEAFKNAGGANAFSELNESGNILQNKYYKTTFDEVRDQQKTMEEDMNRFFVEMDDELERKGYKIGQMTVAQQQAVLLGFKTQFEGLKLSSQETLDYLMGLVSQHYGIELDVKDELFRAKVDEATRLLNGLINGEWKVDLNFATNINDVIDKARKNYKTAKEYFENAKPIMMKFGVNASFGKEIPMMKMTETLNGIKDKGARDFVEQVMNGWNEAAKAIQQSIDASTKGGFSLEDPNKSKKNKSKSGSKKAYKDEEVEKWKKRVDSIKEAYSEYSKMEKEIGDAAAIAEVKKMFDGVIDEKVLDDIKNYKKYIVEIQDLVRKRYESQKGNKKYDNGKQAEELLRRINKLVVNINMDELARKSERWASGLSDQLEQLTRRWEIFNSVREATGDRKLAEQLAGFGDGEKGLRNSAEAMKRQIESEIASMGSAPKIPIELDINASDSDIQDNIKQALGGTEYEDRIKGITDAVKKWRDAMRSVLREDIQGMGKLMGSVVSYAAQIKKIDDDLVKTKEQIANSGATEAQQRQMTSFAEAQADWKKMKLSADYSNLYNKTIAMSRTEFENAANAVQKMIDKLRDLGAISPDEYLQEVDKLNKARMEWSTGGFLGERGAFGNFISGGNDGLMNYYAQRRDKALQNAEKTTDSEEKKKYNQEAEHYGKLFKRLSELSDAAKDVMTAFQTLQSGIDLLGGLFDSLGMEGASNAMSDAGGILGGALQGASSLSALGPYGMAAGAAVGLIGGIAQVHDKALERHINKLREDVRGIEANTELIVRSRERTLGYDMGDLRRQMAQQYATPSYSGGGGMALIVAALSGSNQKKSMYEYYMQNSQGTGYEQEYANLVEQREKYMEILKDQQDKKKKSNEEIEETKSKIAELDDQIMNFSQDLAKELWGIDIKGWADQLSDALASAFENGENMAEAYREAVTSIIQQMMQKMMQMSILEPMFKRLQSQLFGENGKGGVFDFDNPQSSMSKVTKVIGDFFGKGGEGEKAITASMEFMTAFQKGMQDAGLTVLNEASNTLSSGIQGTSEETSDLLAGCVNALRQDVSVNRILLTQYVTQLWPQYIEAYTAQVTSVSNIDNNVRVIMEMMQLGNGAMYEQIAAMRSRIDNIVLGIDSISIR